MATQVNPRMVHEYPVIDPRSRPKTPSNSPAMRVTFWTQTILWSRAKRIANGIMLNHPAKVNNQGDATLDVAFAKFLDFETGA